MSPFENSTHGRLKTLQVVEPTFGGVGQHVLDLCQELLSRGHDVHALYSPVRMRPAFRERLESMPGLTATPVPMRRSPHPADLLSLARVVAYVRKHGPFSLIHGHSSKAGALARMAGVLTGHPAAYTPNAFRTADPTVAPAERFVFRYAERILAAGGSEIIAVSDNERNHGIDIGLDPRRIHVCLNGLPARSSSEEISRSELGIPEDAVVVGFVGRLSHQKAPERMIEIARGVSDPNVHWVMVGDGPLRDGLLEQARAAGFDSRFHWAGARDGYSLMKLFDVFALPSRYEGFAYVLIEALQRGLPIVVHDIGGAEHAVEHGVNGFVCDEGDVESLIEGVRELVRRPDLRAAMAGKSLERADLFTLTRMVDRTESVYRKALARYAC